MVETRQAQLIRRFIESMPSTLLLGIEVISLDVGCAELRLQNRRELTFDGATVQGGLVTVLADYAAVAACGSMLPEGWLMATIGCEAHNTAPANGQYLVAEAEVLKPGKRHAVARVDVRNNSVDGDLCLTGLFTATGVPGTSP